jgi:predicted MPP superfamily phosphohydrolase
MGFLFLAFTGSLLLYLLDVISWTVRTFTSFPFPVFSGKLPAAGMAALCLGLVVYGYFEASQIIVERQVIQTEKLPADVNSIRIVQISDIHLGILNRDKSLAKIMDAVKNLSPDLLVCTGDLVDGSMKNLMHLSEIIKAVQPPYGKYSVTGNHEYYAGLDHSLEFMEKAGFELLRGRVKMVGKMINVAGIDDGGHFRKAPQDNTLDGIQNNLFTLYLKHRPEISENSLGKFDLQLSGHTHNGQIFPFNYLVMLEFPFIRGYYRLQNGSALYVNRGSGTWGPPIRFLSPPEITLIEIVKKNINDPGQRDPNATVIKR